jgi:hypothetical protein
MQTSNLDNRVTRSSARPTPSTPAPPSSSTDPVIEPLPVSAIDLPETPTIVPNPVDHLPPDEEIAILTADSSHRFAPGTSLEARLQFHLDLHLRLCDLDLAELPPQMTPESQVFSLNFLNRRQEAITSLLTLTEARIIRLRSRVGCRGAAKTHSNKLPKKEIRYSYYKTTMLMQFN